MYPKIATEIINTIIKLSTIITIFVQSGTLVSDLSFSPTLFDLRLIFFRSFFSCFSNCAVALAFFFNKSALSFPVSFFWPSISDSLEISDSLKLSSTPFSELSFIFSELSSIFSKASPNTSEPSSSFPSDFSSSISGKDSATFSAVFSSRKTTFSCKFLSSCKATFSCKFLSSCKKSSLFFATTFITFVLLIFFECLVFLFGIDLPPLFL